MRFWLLLPFALLRALPAPAQEPCEFPAMPAVLSPVEARFFRDAQKAVSAALPRSRPKRPELSCHETLPMLQAQLEESRSLIALSFPELEKWEDSWLDQTLAPNSLKTEAEACEQYERLSEVLLYFKNWQKRREALENLAESFRYGQVFLRAELDLHQRREPARTIATCLRDIGDIGITVAASLAICRDRTNVKGSIWKTFASLGEAEVPVLAEVNCLLAKKTDASVKKNIELGHALDQEIKIYLNDLSHYLSSRKKKIDLLLPRARVAQLKLFPLTRNCPLKKELGNLQNSIPRLVDEAEVSGTAFYVEAGGRKKEMITAHHVVHESNLAPIGVESKPGAKRVPFQFEMAPGKYNVGNDIVRQEATSTKPALRTVSENTVARAGEEIFLYGYPQTRADEFTRVRCKILGISPGVGNDAAYAAYCPGVEAHLGGISGGPAINREGEAIGAVSAHLINPNVVLISPVSHDAEGKIHLGFQKAFAAEHCYPKGFRESKPCRVMPGLTFEEVIP